MRRLFLLLVAGLLVGVATVASASGHQRVSRIVVCPLSASVVSCCGPPVKIEPANPLPCCPGPVQPACQPSLSIAASPDPLTAGTQVTISGALTHSSAAGTTVQLWQKLAGKHSFSKGGTAATDVSGNWSMSIAAGKVMTNRSWYATADGLQSPTISEPVSALVKLRAGGGKLSGSVSPAHPRERVQLQRLSGKKWVTIRRARLTRRSRFSFTRSGLHGTLRVLLGADKENALSASNKLVLS